MTECTEEPTKRCELMKACIEALGACTLCAAKSREARIDCADDCQACSMMLDLAMNFLATTKLPHTEDVLRLSATLAEECSSTCCKNEADHCQQCARSCSDWAKLVRDIPSSNHGAK